MADYEVIDANHYLLTREPTQDEEILLSFCKAIVQHSTYVLTVGSEHLLGIRKGESPYWIVIPAMEEEEFCRLLDTLRDAGFWSVSHPDDHDAYEALTEDKGALFAPKDEVDPEIHLFFMDPEGQSLSERIELRTDGGVLFIAAPTIPPEASLVDD